jgi:hypothetical protein
MDRRHFIGGTAAAVAALTIGPGYAADDYPSHPITLINPFPPGGAADKVGQPLKAVLEPIDLRLCRGRQAVRPHAEIHPRRLHPDRALRRRPLRIPGQ